MLMKPECNPPNRGQKESSCKKMAHSAVGIAIILDSQYNPNSQVMHITNERIRYGYGNLDKNQLNDDEVTDNLNIYS